MKLIRYAVTHPVTVWMVTLAAVVFGLTALGRLDLRLLPEIRYPSLTVQTDFPGTAPVDVENLLTKPIEESVGVIRNVRTVRSVSRSGQSDVTLEFLWGTDMDVAGVDVREKVDILDLPLEASRPLHPGVGQDEQPAVDVTLGSVNESTLEAKIAEYCGVRHAIGCASGSDAILLPLLALDLPPGS